MPTRREFNTAPMGSMLQHFINDARESFPVLQTHFSQDRPDAVCTDMMTSTGRLLAHVLSVPEVALVPNFAANEHFSLRSEMAPSGFENSPEMQDFIKQMQEFYAEHGVTGDPDTLSGHTPPELNLVFLPREFQIAGQGFDERFRFLGPLLERQEQAEPPTPADSDAPLLYISLGTAFNNDLDFYRTCLQAFRGTRWQVLLATGHRVDPADLGEIPPNVEVHAHVPQLAVLRRADVFVSHAGMNSTMEALASGVPLVAVPQMPEQEANARRAEELGLGRRTDPDTLTAEGLREVVDEVAGNDDIRANLATMRRVLTECGGARAGADAIEAHVA